MIVSSRRVVRFKSHFTITGSDEPSKQLFLSFKAERRTSLIVFIFIIGAVL